ncbi:uncharacterized protein LOC114350774 [Ostrinia furnacalis]|uniref:uncharacterized protein LOC114350774 n=1 Tax=Ostrinia furnacalis TaxID=93504 RepID=UPI00103AD648|nr:uncharacterized protein LOC114350774 [Ostrinia furnacalis]
MMAKITTRNSTGEPERTPGASDGGTAEGGFRVRVNLERFFSDERARVLLSVRGARRVRWLARRLRRLFPLPRRLALLSRGHLLPPDEPLALLQHDDPVEVILETAESNEDTTSALYETINNGEFEASPVQPDHKKRKIQEDLNLDNHSAVTCGTDSSEPVAPAPGATKDAQATVPVPPWGPNGLCERTAAPLVSRVVACSESDESVSQSQENREPTQDIPSDGERLKTLKVQALAILDEISSRPRKRPRVRRRRRRPAPPSPIVNVEVDVLAAAAESPPAADAAGAAGAGDAAGELVLRNPCAAPRSPRLVRSLLDAASD